MTDEPKVSQGMSSAVPINHRFQQLKESRKLSPNESGIVASMGAEAATPWQVIALSEKEKYQLSFEHLACERRQGH
ncbi:MAG: hypothetical protein NT179_09505 [Nitrospirae bacterium]|nr:hypothetical protein [Nitrospirota bacterium]